jgi:hypothetical protein
MLSIIINDFQGIFFIWQEYVFPEPINHYLFFAERKGEVFTLGQVKFILKLWKSQSR